VPPGPEPDFEDPDVIDPTPFLDPQEA